MRSSELRHVVVAGGSVAAMTAAQTLRMEGFDGIITMLSEEERSPYTRVPLSKERLADIATDDDLQLATPSDVDLHLQLCMPATALDPVAQLVRTPAGDLSYDGLVIATGARARRLAPELDELVLRQLEDCHLLQERLSAARSLLVVGGGFLGMEVASTAAGLGLDVTVVDVVPPLDRLLGPLVAGRVRKAAQAQGVRLVVAESGIGLVGDRGGKRVRGAMTGDGRFFGGDVVLTAAGDVPNSSWLGRSGLSLSNGAVVVDPHGRVDAASFPNVVAVGDVAVTRLGDGRETRTATWTNAVEQAGTAVRSLLHGEEASPYRPADYFWTHQFGLDIKLVGSPGPSGQPTTSRIDPVSGGTLLVWQPAANRPAPTAVTINHPMRPAKLRRMFAATRTQIAG
jgi:3-phenylpropionate/trans-cinnamate dioxygenase ferredoxin reductase component